MNLREELEALRLELAAAPDPAANAAARVDDPAGPGGAALFDLLRDLVSACAVQVGPAEWHLPPESGRKSRTRVLSESIRVVCAQYALRRGAP